MQDIALIGFGQVARERILPAAKVLASEGVLNIRHVVDVLPAEQAIPPLAGVLPVAPQYHRIEPEPGALGRLLDTDLLEALPLLIATPTWLHAEQACAALSRRHAVGLEKPMASTRAGLDELAACRADGRQHLLFPFAYYLLEKALPLLALARRGGLSDTQLTCLEGIELAHWGALREELGELRRVRAELREGPDPRAWVLSEQGGGHTLETFSHLIAIVLPWVDSLRLSSVALGRAQAAPELASESIIHAEFVGSRGEFIDLTCEKWCAPDRLERSARFEFEGGSALIDFESEELIVCIGGAQHRARVRSNAKYEPQLRMFASKLVRSDEATEYDVCRQSVITAMQVREAGLKYAGDESLNSSL